jgi:hypothetical protein
MFEFGKGRVKVTCGDKTFVGKQDAFAASCERLAAKEVEKHAAVLTDAQLRAWIETELTDKDFRRAVLVRVSPEVWRRLGA